MSATLVAGRVGKPHGLDGSFYVTRARPVLLKLGTAVTVSGLTHEIERRAGTDENPIVRLDGCSNREGALALRGEDLIVSVGEAPTLPDGEWWAEEFAGLEVFDGETKIGTVKQMIGLPSCECLEVQRVGGGSDLLIPLVRDAVLGVDMQARRVTVSLAFLGEEA